MEFALQLSDAAPYPFAALAVSFVDEDDEPSTADLSGYHELTFSVKCGPSNVLSFSASIFDAGVSELGEPLSYRPTSTHFACEEQWSPVTIDLTRLETPQWWLEAQDLKLSMTDYQLSEVSRLLSAGRETSIAEIAYSVGYKNVSYFNTLFKDEYGCTPKAFKNLSGQID